MLCERGEGARAAAGVSGALFVWFHLYTVRVRGRRSVCSHWRTLTVYKWNQTDPNRLVLAADLC